MKDDPIVSEVRKVREAHAARFDYDLRAIYEDLKEQERLSGRAYIRLQAKRLGSVKAGEKAV